MINNQGKEAPSMKSHPRIISSVFALSVISAVALSGCAAGTPVDTSPTDLTGTVTVGYAGGGAVDTYMAAIIKHAEELLPNVTIKTAVYPTYDDQLSQLPTQFAAGTAPDITLWDNSAPVAEYATEGAIASMDDLIGSTDVDLSSFPDALVNGWKIDNKLYAVPSYLQNSAYVYNQDVLAAAGITELPTTLDQLGEDAKTVKATTGKPGIVILENLFHLTQYMVAFGGGYDSGKSIDSAENVKALDFLLGLFKDGSAATAEEVGATWDGEAIGNNAAAMSDGGPWYIGFMAASAPNTKYELTTLPGSSNVTTYGGGFSISAKSKQKDVDMAVIAALTDSFSQEAILTTGLGYVPAATKYVGEYRDQTPAYAAFTDAVLSDGVSLSYPEKTTEFGNDLVAGFQKLTASGSISSKDLLTELQQKYGK
jgi:multiple sugar transport system substrate-binding protein